MATEVDEGINIAPQGTSAELATCLASFKNLSKEDRSKALQYILQDSSQSASNPSTPSTIQGEALEISSHTCKTCQKLIIRDVKLVHARDEGTFNEHIGSIQVSKAEVVQALDRRCVLAQWVLAVLNRELIGLKSNLDQKGIRRTTSRPTKSLESAASDLDYLSPGEDINVTVKLHPGDDAAALCLDYELDPLIMDKFWALASNMERVDNDYIKFASRYVPRTSNSFRIFTTQDDPAAAVIDTRPHTTAIDSEASFDLARSWLNECRESHPSCQVGTGILPSRVIDVGTRFPIRSVRLHWTEDGETGQFAALSYCWGGPQTLATTQTTAQDFTDGMLFSKFPKTLQDAIITTFKLNLRYLWIDCICIIQDDPDDVAREVSKMSQIFSEATVTISAASARSVHDGFLEPRRPSVDPPLKLTAEITGGDMGAIYMEQPQRYKPEDDPISLRAWTLQEHVLSSRTLMYSSRELWWSCSKSSVQATTGSVNTPYSFILSEAGSRQSLDYWRSIIRDYTRRFLTFSSDKLPAIAGVASIYSGIFGGAYLAGLWEFAFGSELLWSSKRSDISRPAVQRAPSWSWAAVDGEICHDWCPLDHTRTLDILFQQVTPVSTSSPFGSIDPLRSVLRVEGEIGRFYWRDNKKSLFITREIYWDKDFDEDVARTAADAHEPIPTDSETGDMVVWALVVSRNPTRGLVLAQISDDTYRRVGIFYRFWQEHWIPTERRIISIV